MRLLMMLAFVLVSACDAHVTRQARLDNGDGGGGGSTDCCTACCIACCAPGSSTAAVLLRPDAPPVVREVRAPASTPGAMPH